MPLPQYFSLQFCTAWCITFQVNHVSNNTELNARYESFSSTLAYPLVQVFCYIVGFYFCYLATEKYEV